MQLKSLIEIGTHSLDDFEKDGVKATNLIACIMGVISLFYTAVFYIIDTPYISYICIFSLMINFLSVLLNRLKLYAPAKVTLKVGLDLSMFLGCLAIGLEAGIQFAFIIPAILPFLMFRTGFYPVMLSMLSPLCFLILFIWDPTPLYQDVPGISILNVTVTLIVFMLVTLVLYILSNINSMSQKRLKNSIESKHSLVNMLAHDVSNPLTAALGHVNILMRKNDINSKEFKSLTVIERSLLGINQIVKNVRSLQSIEQGKFQAEYSLFTVQSTFDELLEMFEEKCKSKDLKLNIIHGFDKSDTIYSDKSALVHTILANILSNAIKFSHEYSAIDFIGKRVDSNLKIEIRDYGDGIPKNIMEHLFDQNKPTTRRGTKGETGTGFGMPLVKLMADLLEIELSITSWTKDDTDSHNKTGTLFSLLIKKESNR